MKFIRYQSGVNLPRFGWIHGDMVGPVEGTPYGEYRRLEADIPLERVRLLAPLIPGKIICVGRNYVEHAREHGAEVPEVPIIFLKPPSAVIGPGDEIILPPQSQQVDHEAELAVVIGRTGRWIQPDESAKYILGYTVANDVTARDLQHKDGQWTRGKGFDTFCPLGPWIETEFDPADALITCRVNGELRQMTSSREMVFNINHLTAFISSVMTLNPGDIILTGTPAGVGPLKKGDSVEVSIDGIGNLVNSVGLAKTNVV
jgi:2-keto-4-pentenoate hydratase/2-oxohepta-3-ene-1,7-dioic acid hydratase in catechol pathway